MSETEGDVDGDAATFADALAELKESGSLLLVAGRGQAAMEAACTRLLGESTSEPRRRLLVRTNGGPTASANPSAGPLADAAAETRAVSYRATARSTAAASGDVPSGVPSRVVEGDLADLHDAVEAEIAAFDTPSFAPAELRICLDAADTLLAEFGEEEVFRFVHALAATVRDTRAMCHVHLPAAFDSESVQVLVPLFDAVIEVRPGAQQRWHLRDRELTTGWLEL